MMCILTFSADEDAVSSSLSSGDIMTIEWLQQDQMLYNWGKKGRAYLQTTCDWMHLYTQTDKYTDFPTKWKPK